MTYGKETNIGKVLLPQHRKSIKHIRLVPAQDVHFFYTRYHFSALQNCALLFSTNFQFIFTFKNALHNLVIELCSALKQ